MIKVIWYWEYQLKVWNDEDSTEEILSGIVAASTITKAMKKLENYYGDDIMEVQKLKPIMDGVFEFQTVMKDNDFDFIINTKN